MKISAYTKRLSVVALVLGVAVGCATAPEQQMAETCEGVSPDVQAAIDEAKAANAEARLQGAEWRGARKLINQAEAAGAECDDEMAMQYAQEAELMAQESLQAYMAMQEQDTAETEPAMEEMSDDRMYTVERGDTLWGIAGSSVGYNDPYQWPLIYRANQSKIKDPDLIYPGQRFEIEANPSAAAVNAAVQHARSRGEWSLGVTEEADWRFLQKADDM